MVRITLVALMALLLVGCSASQTVEEPKPAEAAASPQTSKEISTPKAPVAPVPLEEYFKIKRIGSASFSYDDKFIAYLTDQGGRLDIWVKPMDGGEPKQITQVSGFVQSFQFSPKKDQLVFETDQGGNELPHIFLTDSSGKDPKDLMAGDPQGSRTQFIAWADNGSTFLYLSSRRDLKFLDLYEYNLASNQSKLLWTASGNLAFAVTSRDQKNFVIAETLSDVDSNLYLLKRGQKKPTLLTPHKGEILYSPTSFSPDGRKLFFTSDQDQEFRALYEMDLKTRKSKEVLKANWDVDYAGYSEGWTYFYTVTNEDGTPKVVITDAKTGKEVPVPSLGGEGALVPLGGSTSDRFLAATLMTDTAPVDLFVIDFKENKVLRITDVLPDSLRGRKMVAGEVIRIPSFDGKEVPAFLYRPEGSGPFPAMINVHGGPTYQSKRRFDPFTQYLVSKGYVVLVPNVRGSTGYGKSYTKLDNLDLGGGPLKDVVACKNWMVQNAKADANKVVVQGGSYGGYMALAAASFTPGEFAANVDYFGPSDLKSLVESFPPYWTSFATYIYSKFGNPTNPEHTQYQHDRSPINFVDKIERPLLVVQGENDARVKKDQSDKIVEALKARNIPVHYMILPGEGHGFSKEENRMLTYQLTDRFFDRYLFGDTSVEVTKP